MLQRMMLRLRRLGAARPLQAVHTSEQLRWVLQRERARSDRTGRIFSLLIFSQRETQRGDPLRALVRILQERLRCYDEIGLLEEGRLGVVLPDTPGSGAWKVADDVVSLYPTRYDPPLCDVYTYPTNWSTLDADSGLAEAALNDSSLEDSCVEDSSLDDSSLDGAAAGSDTWQTSDDADEQDQRPIHRMEELFVLRMPLWKRGLDMVGALVGLTLFSPVLAAAALAVRLSSPGPVLFTQWRAGVGNRRFLMFKLRTMSVDAERRKRELMTLNEQDGPAFKIKHDPRVTAVGRWLRRTSVDELPQFWNVLKGDMSLVGPRPLPCDESDACQAWQKHRLDVTPGLTCIWQVRGRSQVSFDNWVRMDMQYIRARSPWADVKLLLQTVLAVVLRRGAC